MSHLLPRSLVLVTAVLLIAGASVSAVDETQQAPAIRHFENKVRPLLIRKCAKCHGPDKQESGLRVDRAEALFRGGDSGPVVIPGQPERSRLIQLVRGTDELKMPPETPLSKTQIAELEQWVRDGAVWPDDDPSTATGDTGNEPQSVIAPRPPNDGELADVLQLWLKADAVSRMDGEPVYVWPDQSGRGHDLAATEGVRLGGVGKPPVYVAHSRVNGFPAVRFAAGCGMAGSPDHVLDLHGDAAVTILLVGHWQPCAGLPPYDNVLMIGNPAAPTNPGRPLAAYIEIDRANGGSLDFAGGFSHDAVLGPGSAEALYGSPCVLTITKAPGPLTATTRFYFDGRSAKAVLGREPSGTDAVPAIEHRRDIGVSIGKGLDWCGSIQGDYAEVIVYNRTLTVIERQAVEHYLANKYSLLTPAMIAHAARSFTAEQKSHWAFQPARRPPLPAVRDQAWSASPVDRFVLAKLDEAGLTPAPHADRRTLIRRVTFDLLGLPPMPDEIDAFVNDPAPDEQAIAKVVDRLLASPHYGERWGRHWLDVVRYAESTANDANAILRYAWRYRDYVIRALNADKPYNQFLIEQLAGDLLPPTTDPAATADAVIATGFLMVGPKALAETDKEQSRLDVVDDQLDVTSRTFLALTVTCSRCHDHKFDPIPTVDYYSLAGIFRSTEIFRDDVRNASMWQEWPLTLPDQPELIVMAPKEATPVNLRVHLRGNRHTLGAITPRRFLQVIAGEDHAPLTTSHSGRLELARWIASPDNALTARVMVNRLWQHHFGTGLVATSDNFGARGERPSHPELLDWLAAEFVLSGWSLKHVHRLMVLSSTYQQSAATNPESQLAATNDPDNRLLGRRSVRRLDAESMRDAMLAVSGWLDPTPGGSESGEFLYGRGEVIDKNRDFFRPNRVNSDDSFYTACRRRSVYLPVVRNSMPDLLALFDGADPNGVTSTRNDTTVPSQALFLLNHPFVRETALHFAQRLLVDPSSNDAERIALGYRLALGRLPTATETEAVNTFRAAYRSGAQSKGQNPEDAAMAAWQSFCQTLLCRNEFLYLN